MQSVRNPDGFTKYASKSSPIYKEVQRCKLMKIAPLNWCFTPRQLLRERKESHIEPYGIENEFGFVNPYRTGAARHQPRNAFQDDRYEQVSHMEDRNRSMFSLNRHDCAHIRRPRGCRKNSNSVLVAIIATRCSGRYLRAGNPNRRTVRQVS